MKDNKAKVGDCVLIVAMRDDVIESYVGTLSELREDKEQYDKEMKGGFFDRKAYIVQVIDTPEFKGDNRNT